MAILYEDRAILAVDKQPGWILGPDDWMHTQRNLSLLLQGDVRAGEFWAKSRNLKFIRFIHRLDGPTSGVMLWAKSQGALEQYSRLFATRAVQKTYLAVIEGTPLQKEWIRRDPIGPEPGAPGRYMVDHHEGKEAETRFQLLDVSGRQSLVLAEPHSGRTHQIRLHLLASGHPVVGDELYGRRDDGGLGLRAIRLEFRDPFMHRQIRIDAPVKDFCWRYGFRLPELFRAAKPAAHASLPAEVASGRPSAKPSAAVHAPERSGAGEASRSQVKASPAVRPSRPSTGRR